RTFDDKYGVPTLNLGFFLEVAERMGEQALLVFARHEGRTVAGALNFMSGDTLYGRHWGTTGDYHSLHFEVCYHQGIKFCIRAGLRRFEPGAQGEYKVSRGFVPTATWSAHWIRDPAFRAAIGRHTRQEQAYVEAYMAEMNASAPYRQSA
ncbi:MAG: GNAT family N-acetyltransferase, partial [Gammaproteobacteria bacterium]|nr:GNAT family N-acetyltransferase [Gammaproteobacteria bacterium]